MSAQAISGMIFLNVFGLITASLTVNKYLNKKIDKKTFNVFIVYALLMMVYGLLLISYKPFLQYSPLHLISVAFFIYSGFILLYAQKYKVYIMWGFFTLYIILNLIKVSYLWVYGYSLYAILPLHICSLSSVFMIARPFYIRGNDNLTKSFAGILDNYLICFAFLGAFLNIFLPPVHGFGLQYNFFSLQTFESNFTHWSFFTLSIFYLLSGEIKPNKRLAVMNLLWIVPLYIIFIFLNSIFEHNFFYTNRHGNPILFLYNLFPIWEYNLGNFAIEINPIYWVIINGISIVVLYLITSLFEFIWKKYGKKDKNDRVRHHIA